jgi:hypothetical protein
MAKCNAMASDDEAPAWLKRAHRNFRRQWKEYKAGRRREMPDSLAHAHREVMGGLEREWEASKNPLYVWEAIQFALKPAGRLDLPLPGWCRRYLAEAAHQIVAELRKAHPPHMVRSASSAGGHSNADDPPPAPHDGGDAARNAGELNDLALRALGFRRDGWNAFREYAASYRHERLRIQFSQLLADGLSRRAARDVILRATDRDDDRELRRLLKDVQAPPSSEEEGDSEV